MAYSRVFERPWYVQRSIENNPLHKLNVNNGLEGIVDTISINGNSEINYSFGSYATRVANNIFSAVPTSVKGYGLAGSLAALLYFATACLGGYIPPTTPTPRDTPTPVFMPVPSVDPASTKIAFVASSQASSDIYVINGDGSNEKQLTSAECADIDPVWSPGGKRIAFVSYRDSALGEVFIFSTLGWKTVPGFVNNSNIYVMNPDGSRQIRLTSSKADDLSPSWSPNGDRIAYESREENNSDIYIMKSNGSENTFLTSGQSPTWSPVDDKIAFIDNGLYVINADSSNKTNLASDVISFKWSPDGKRIAFVQGIVRMVSNGPRKENIIYVINNDGSGRKTIDEYFVGSLNIPQLTWSPDSQHLAYTDHEIFSRSDRASDHFISVVGDIIDDYRSPGAWSVSLPINEHSILAWSPHGDVIAVTYIDPKEYTPGRLSKVVAAYNLNDWHWGDITKVKMTRWGDSTKVSRMQFSWSPILYPHTTQGIEAIVKEDEPPEYLSNNPQAKDAYTQASSILQDSQLTLQDKQKKIKILQNTLGEEIVTEVIRHIPAYDEFSGELVAFDTYLRSLSARFGEGYSQVSGAPIDVDPVGAGMRMFFDTTPETILAMTGLYNEQKKAKKAEFGRVSDRCKVY